MKNSREKPNRFNRFPWLIAVIMIGSLSILGACSSDDDAVAIDPNTGVSAFNFNANNTTIAAEIAAAAMDFFPTFNEIGLVMIDTLSTGDPLDSPFADVIPCTNAPAGSTSLSWVDTDSSGALSKGDTATLTFTACDLDNSGETISGTVVFAATEVIVPVSLGIDVSINLTINLGADTTTVAGDFVLIMSSTDGGVTFTNVYKAIDTLGHALTITENGTPYFKAGCFNVIQTFNIVSVFNGFYELDPSGVINASNQVLSLEDGSGSPLMFFDRAMYEGTQRLLSRSEPNCASVGAPVGVADSDGSYMDMEAFSSLMTLNTYDVNDNLIFSVGTTWTALID